VKTFPEEIQAILGETREQYRDLILAVEIKSTSDAVSFYKAVVMIPEAREALAEKFGLTARDLIGRAGARDPLNFNPKLDAVVKITREAIEDRRFHA